MKYIVHHSLFSYLNNSNSWLFSIFRFQVLREKARNLSVLLNERTRMYGSNVLCWLQAVQHQVVYGMEGLNAVASVFVCMSVCVCM